MSGSVKDFRGRNGILRKFAHPLVDDVLSSKVSQDGTFCAALTHRGLLSFPTLTSQPVKVHVPGEINGFCWVQNERTADYDLSLPGIEEYLVVVDLDCNICIYSVWRNEKADHPSTFKLASYISNETLAITSDANERAETTSVTYIVDAIYDDTQHSFGIFLIINDQRLLKVLAKQDQEPFVDLDIKVHQYSDAFNGTKCGFLCSKVKGSLLLLIDEYAVLYIISLESNTVLQKYNLLGKGSGNDECRPDDILHENGDVYHICSISSNLQYVLIYNDDERKLYQVQLNVERIEFLSQSARTPGEEHEEDLINEQVDDATALYGISIQNEVWKNEINVFHKEITRDGVINSQARDSYPAAFTQLGLFTTNDPMEREPGWIIESQERLTLPEWTDGFRIEEVILDKHTALIRMAYLEKDVTIDGETNGSLNSIIMQFDIEESTFVAQSLPEKAVLASAESGFFPTCILSRDLFYVPTFDTTQEQLISNIIQYTGIVEAEIICRANQWSQFSIPLHSLEVGLQHRQIDTISFFLRTRDKAFSRYWKHLSDNSVTTEQSTGVVNREEFSGSPSLRSILVKSSIESTSIDPNELYRAVDMLVKGIHHDSKGKHKKNFFETLLRLTVDFLNSLIMDGVSVLESLNQNGTSHYKEPTASFTFLADIPESLNYLVSCIVDVRQFIGDIPGFYPTQEGAEDSEDRKEVRPMQLIKSQKEYMEAEIYAGRLPQLQKYLLENERQDDLDCSFEALTRFGLDFAFRKVKERDMEASLSIMKNLGADERGILRRLFDTTLDKGLRNYLLSEFDKEPYKDLLSEEDAKEVQYLRAVEEAYPCNVYNTDNIKDHWEKLKANLHDVDDLVNDADSISLKSLCVYDEKDVEAEGLYSEVTFKWVKEWDDRSRKLVFLDGAFQTNQLDRIDKIADAATLWEYLTSHSDTESILEWIRSSQTRNFPSVAVRGKFPPFDPSLIHSCGHATRQVQKEIYREFLRLGIYTDGMKEEFDSILKIVSEDCSLFRKSDDTYTVPPIFINQFIEHCLQYNLREVLYMYLDHHEIYPCENEALMEKYPWFKMMSAFRNYQKDKRDVLSMSLNSTENMLSISGEELKDQLCRNTPLTILATVLASSLELHKVLVNDSPESAWVDKVLLRDSLRKYPTLHAAIFSDNTTKEEATTVQLLQDNTPLDAITFFKWRNSGDSQLCVPNFSSNELVKHYGLQVNMTYTYYLKQKRPVYAYLIFVKDIIKRSTEKEYCVKKAFWEAYQMVIENFDKIPIVCACIFFVDLLGMDSYPMRVDIESANFILKEVNTTDSTRFDTEEKLRNFIVVSLKKENDERIGLLELLEDCVEAGLKEKNFCWSSFEAILYYRIAVQFAQVSNLAPPTRLIEEAIKDGCWFHAIVFMQIYQLKPSEILPSLERSMKNTVLYDHVYAIVKNAKEMMKVQELPTDQELKPMREKKVKQGASLERDFRAQFYFNLKKGPENRPVEGSELVSPTKSPATPSAVERIQKQSLNKSSSGSNESINERVLERHGTRMDTIQHLDDILDIVLECEDTKYPSEMLLKYSTHYSQPFLAVLAACYLDHVPLNCFSCWVISSVGMSHRKVVFESISDLERLDWTIEEMFCLLSDVLKKEEKSLKIIADGFKIFMPKNTLYSFFQFCHSFAANEDQAVCIRYLKAFVSAIEKIEDGSLENGYFRAFFNARIPIKVFTKFRSNFYKAKLLQSYIESGLDKFVPRNSISFSRLKSICELTKDTSVTPDYLALASCVENRVGSEEDRIFDLLIEQMHLDKALELSKLLGLPGWKVVFSQVENDIHEMKKSGLWQSPDARFEFWVTSNARLRKCLCSRSFAGSFFEDQGLTNESFPYEERALLFAFAFSWYTDTTDDDITASIEQKIKSNELEKKTWLLKMNAEIQKLETGEKESAEQFVNSKLLNSYNEKISELLSQRSRTYSDVSYQKGASNLLIHDDDVPFAVDEEQHWGEKENEAFELMIDGLLEKGEIAQARRVSNLFGKKTHDLELVLASISLAQGLIQIESLSEPLKAFLEKTPARRLSLSGSFDQGSSMRRSVSSVGSLSSSGRLMSEWVFVEEAQCAIEKLLSKCRKGKKCCEMVLLCFRVSKILSMSYADVVSLEPFEVLQQLIFCDMDQQLTLCRQFLKVFCIKDEEVAAFIKKIVLRLIQSKANIELESLTLQEYTDSTKLNPNEIPRFMQLVQKPSILGTLLLEEAKSLESNHSSGDDDNVNLLEVRVELLTRAHDCFTLSCNMEGISDVLQAARLCNVRLVESKSYSLMVRMLTGIGRFKEMSYIIEALDDKHHFELLFRKDIEKEAQLKIALLEYIKKHHPNDTDKIEMLSIRFGMHREIGEQYEETGEKEIRAIISKFSAMPRDMEMELKSVVKIFSYAAANYKKVACLQKSTRCLKVARLAELQIRLLPQGKQILGLEKHSMNKVLCSHQDFYEALIIADAYGLLSPVSWVDPLYERVILKGDMVYLRQYLSVFQLTGQVLMEIVSRYRSERSTSNMKEHLKELLVHLKDVKLRYKIAWEFNINDIISNLLEKPNGAYVKDSKYSF